MIFRYKLYFYLLFTIIIKCFLVFIGISIHSICIQVIYVITFDNVPKLKKKYGKYFISI